MNDHLSEILIFKFAIFSLSLSSNPSIYLSINIFFIQSTTDNEEREREREREESSYASAYRQQQQQQALHLQQQQQQLQQQQLYQLHHRQPTPSHFPHPDNIINENRQNIRHHIKPKTSLINSNNNNPDTTTNNNNNNVNLANNNHKFGGVQQVNSSSKMLDNQKYQKYFAKRKILAQYEQEMRAEKRNRLDRGDSLDDEMSTNNGGAEDDNNRPLNMRRSQSDATEDENRSSTTSAAADNSVGLNLIQNIKKEKGDDVDGGHTDVNGNDDGIEMGTGVGFYGTHLSKMKHSILEPNIVLQHSDEVISSPSNGAPTNSITSTLQNNNTNLSQKTAS